MSVGARLARTTCAHCGQEKRCSHLILDKPVCPNCELRFARTAKTCPGCGGIKVLAFYDTHGRPACATCTGNKTRYACVRCGREDSTHGRRCGLCTLEQRAAELLADPSGHIHPQLQPLFNTLMAGPRPETTLYWFNRSTGPAILAAMAQGEIEISHCAFEAMASNKTAPAEKFGAAVDHALPSRRAINACRSCTESCPGAVACSTVMAA